MITLDHSYLYLYKEDIAKTFMNICENIKTSRDDLDEEKEIQKLVYEETDRLLSSTELNINKLTSKIGNFDNDLYKHSIRVATFSMLIGRILGYDENTLKELTLGGLLHDIGKIYIPVDILNKPSKLDGIEMNIIYSHSAFSAYYLRKKYPDISSNILYGVYEHHERLDGTGYPNHIVGEQISEIGRIIAIADIYEAYSAARCYHLERSIKQTVDFIQRVNGLDTRILLEFIKHVDVEKEVVIF